MAVLTEKSDFQQEINKEQVSQSNLKTGSFAHASHLTYLKYVEHTHNFSYQGINFNENNFHIFAGLCAIDNTKNVELIFKALHANKIQTARMGAYKPRTHPNSFQGHGKSCLAKVFELAGIYNIRVIAMEVLHEKHIIEIQQALELAGNSCGVMLQIGTRNAQNFELLKLVGQQKTFPVLYKRGFGNTLQEAFSACEYIAQNGNKNIIFCMRGVKSIFGEPFRNLVDFGSISVVKRHTPYQICIDPSHAVGQNLTTPDNLNDILSVASQGIIAGANLILTDLHPEPIKAVVDSSQALPLKMLTWYLEDLKLVRKTYLKRVKLAKKLCPK